MAASTGLDVFISYTSSDHAPVERIARGLKERGLSVFLDRWELIPGRSWPQALEEQLARCRCALIVLGPSGMGSWQQRERQVALDRQARESNFGVIPVLLPGADPALGFLSLNTWVDLRDGLSDPQALELLAAAIRGEPPSSLSEQSRRAASEVCPYRGLEVFREEDAPFFFGRDAFTARLVERIAARNLLAVVGASGSGKSSVVRAGLIPALRQGANGRVWDLLTLTPGVEPLAALVRALDPPPDSGLIAARAHLNAGAARLRDGEVTLRQLTTDLIARQPGTDRLLLVVDQFEELATLAGDGKDQARFIDLLLEATGEEGDLSVLLTLRSDFYTQLVRRRDLNDRLQDAVVNIGPLSRAAPDGARSELETIIRCPAEAVGLDFEDGLVPRIIADVGDEPGNLPLLEYLLTELWRRRARGLLTHEAYESLGGVQGAIARRADEAYGQLAPDQQQAARRLFLTLVRPGEGQQDTRAPAPFPEDPLEIEVARRFSGPKVRLLVASKEDPSDPSRDPVIEVSHEALIRGWSRLRDWVEQNRETLRARERMRQRMGHWQEREEPDGLLLPPGLELEEGRRLLKADTDVSIDEVRGYIERSIAAEQSRIAEQEARQEAERQRELAVQRQKRRLISSALAVSLLLLALAGWQWWRAVEHRTIAEQQAERADKEADLAVAQRLAATAAKVLDENPGETALAAMIAVESQARRNTPEANAVLRDVLALTPADPRLAVGPADWDDLQLSRDGGISAFTREHAWDAFDEEDFSPHSAVQVLAGDSFQSQSSHEFEALALPSFSPDGRWLVTAGYSRRLTIMDLAKGQVVTDEGYRSAIFPAFSPDSLQLYVARTDGVIERRTAPDWRVTKELSFPVERDRRYPLLVSTDPKGANLLVGDKYRAAYLVPTDGAQPTLLEAFVEGPDSFRESNLSLAMVARSRPVALTQRSLGEATIWDLATGRRLASFKGDARAWSAGFGPDGSWVATGAMTGKVSLRKVGGGELLRRFDHGAPLEKMALSTDGKQIATAGEQGTVVVWDVETGEPVSRKSFESKVEALVFDPQGGSLLVGTRAGLLTRLDPTNGRVLAERKFKDAVAMIAPGGGEARIAISLRATDAAMHWDDTMFIDRETGQERAYRSENGDLRHQTLDPTGKRFAVYDRQGHAVEIWDTATGKSIAQVPDVQVTSLAFSPDGTRLVVETASDRVLVVDPETGEILTELGEEGGVDEAIASPENDQIITQGADGTVRAWNLLTGAELWRTQVDTVGKYVTFSGDGRRLSAWSKAEKRINVVDSRSGKVLATVPSEGGFGTLSFDGSRLVVMRRIAAKDNAGRPTTEAEIWDVDAQVRLRTLQRQSQMLYPTAIPGADFALKSVPAVGPGSRLDLIEGATGELAWSAQDNGFGSISAARVQGATDRLLMVTGSVLELRGQSTGKVIWRTELPGIDLARVATIPGMASVAVPVAPTDGRKGRDILLLDMETGEQIRRIGVEGSPRDIAATADGRQLVAGIEVGDWRGLKVWKIADGSLVQQIEMDTKPSALFPVSDPDLIAVHDFSHNLRIWRLSDGTEVRRVYHTRSANGVTVAQDAPRALTNSGGSLRLWDLTTGGEIAHRVAEGRAGSPSLSSDGRRVAYIAERPRVADNGQSYRTAVIWTPEDQGRAAVFPIDEAHGLGFDGSGRYLLIHGRDGAYLRIVDVSTLSTVGALRPLKNGKLGEVKSSPDGTVLLVGETGRYSLPNTSQYRFGLRVFELETLRELVRADVSGQQFLMLEDSGEIAARGSDRKWRIFDPRLTGADHRFDGEVDYELQSAPGTSRLLVPRYDSVEILDTSDGSRSSLIKVEKPRRIAATDLDDSGSVAVVSVVRGAVSSETGEILVIDARDGRVLARRAVSSPFHSIHFADGGKVILATQMQRSGVPTETGEEMLHWRWRTDALTTLEDTNPIRGVGVSPDGALFASAEGYLHDEKYGLIGERQLRIWRSADGAEIARIPIDFNAYGLDFSPDGRHLVATSYNEVALFRAEDWSLVTDFGTVIEAGLHDGLEGSVERPNALRGLGAAFGDSGRLLIVGQPNGIYLFDVEAKKASRIHDSQVLKRMAISPTGRFLATSGENFTTVWDVESREPISRIKGGDLSALAFGGEAKEDLFAIRDRQLFHLTWHPERLRQLACERFQGSDWRKGRVRVIGETGLHPCDSIAIPLPTSQ